MATTRIGNNRIPNAGFSRAVAPHLAQTTSFFDLLNLRPNLGQLVQTSLIVPFFTLNLLTGEASATNVRYIDVVRDIAANLQYLVINNKNARYCLASNPSVTQLLLPTILQIAVPATNTQNGQVLMFGFNTTDFSTIGDQWDVVIDSATTFKYRKNGGAFTTGVVIGHNVPISINGLIVDFLLDGLALVGGVYSPTAFNIGDTWSWKSFNNVPDSSAVTNSGINNAAWVASAYNTDIYISAPGRHIMRVRNGYITDVGYVPTYGKHCLVIQNHLVVTHFAMGVHDNITGVADPYNSLTTPFTLGWSGLNNPDDMEPTENSEADQYQMPYSSSPDQLNLGITGIAKFGQNNAWIYLAGSMSLMQYVGLPLVFQITEAFPVGNYYPNALVVNLRGHYFIGRDNFYFFDGTQPIQIGEPIRTKFFAEVAPLMDAYNQHLWGMYDSANQEVVWTYFVPNGSGGYQSRQIIYMEKYSRWYFRNMPNATTGATDIFCGCRRLISTSGEPFRLLYAGSGVIYSDQWNEALTGTIPDLPGSAYTQPLVEMNDFYYDFVDTQKEARDLYIDASWVDTGTTNLIPSLAARKFVSQPISYTALSAWLPTTQTGKVRISNGYGHYNRFKFVFTGPKPNGCVFSAYSDGVYGEYKQVQT